jgi:streptomycin 6-kinase
MKYRALRRMVRPKKKQVIGELTNITKIYDAVLRKDRRDGKPLTKKQAATEQS